MALLSYGYRSRPGFERYGCTRRATLMWQDGRAPICWQHAKQASFSDPAVPLDVEAAREYGQVIPWCPK